MSVSATVKWLSKEVNKAARSAKFCIAGSLSLGDPGLEVEGLGPVKVPLKRNMAKALVACCQTAPYGKGTQTLVDKSVRNTFELDPGKFRLSEAWNSAIAAATRRTAEQLGLPADQLEAKLYKLLVYERGGFFLPHRDSEKHDRMVASMIVVLPNPFEGGALLVRHGAAQEKLDFKEAAAAESACFAAFYADCEHEVQRVSRGLRICLAYNLVLKPGASKSPAGRPAATANALAESIRSWVATQPAQPLVFALQHHYTERGLSLDLLKGADRELADLIVATAEKMDCLVHLTQVSRHLVQFADDGSFGRDYYSDRYRRSQDHLEVGETYEDDLEGSPWTDVNGTKQPWNTIALDLTAIVSSTPIDDWKPTSEEYEGYTGNAGNTLDRWYHRSALVVWHRDHHFDIVASSGVAECIPLFCSMVTKLAKTPKIRQEESRRDCIRFARALIGVWRPRRMGYAYSAKEEVALSDEFLEHLLLLEDRDTVALFLSKAAQQDQTVPLRSFVLAACRMFGWNAFAQELKRLVSMPPTHGGQAEIAFRDIEWLSAFCCDKTADQDKSALANELCALAVEQFCTPRPKQPVYFPAYYRREIPVSVKSLPLLLKALAACGRDNDLARVIQFIRQVPDEFTLDDCQVPCLKSLVPWSQKLFGSVPAPLASWLGTVRQQLEAATAREPAPPADWVRPVAVTCTCQYCGQLKAFLADRASEVCRIPAREDMRQHLITEIGRHQCDVKHALERKGSPYALVLTKTTGSFDRAVKRFEADQRLLGELAPL